MKIFYVLTKFFTFPGALLKALTEHIMCKIFKSPVDSTSYLNTTEMSGHVDHELIEKPADSFWYCFIPGLVNFCFGLFLALYPLITIASLGKYTGTLALIGINITNANLSATLDAIIPWCFAWLSFSMFCNLNPTVEDALNMKEKYSQIGTFGKIVFFPGYICMRLGSALENRGITFIIFAVCWFILAIC